MFIRLNAQEVELVVRSLTMAKEAFIDDEQVDRADEIIGIDRLLGRLGEG